MFVWVFFLGGKNDSDGYSIYYLRIKKTIELSESINFQTYYGDEK